MWLPKDMMFLIDKKRKREKTFLGELTRKRIKEKRGNKRVKK